MKVRQTLLSVNALQFPRGLLATLLPLLPVFVLAANPNEVWIIACEIKCVSSETGKVELVDAWYSNENGKAPCFTRNYDDSGIFSCKVMAAMFCSDTVEALNENDPRYKNCEINSTTCWPMKKRLDSTIPKPECAE